MYISILAFQFNYIAFSDFRKLARDFPEVNADHLIEKCVDLGVWCNQVCQTGGRWSLDRLANYVVSYIKFLQTILNNYLLMSNFVLQSGRENCRQKQKSSYE